MSAKYIRGLCLLALLLAAQLLVLGNIHLLGCATPLMYLYIPLLLPRDFPRWGLLLTCFALGLAADAFANTPGVATCSLTLTGFLRPYVLPLFLSRETEEDLRPGVATMGRSRYFYYATTMVVTYALTFFSLEMFSFYDVADWALCVAGSSLITLLLVMVMEMCME